MKKKYSTSSNIEIKKIYTSAKKSISLAGEFPFTRGIYPEMYRERLWTMRQYAGFSTAEESNERYHYLLKQGTSGLSVAFDLPTQIGYDSNHELADGEVGKVGVAIDSIEDMELLFKGISLEQISTSMTINATASTLLALYIAVAKKQGADIKKISGTIQNDILKEYAARGTYIYPPKPSMKIITDIFEYCSIEVPKWNTISISGYHIREAGANAAQELAFTLSNGKAYVKAALAKGLDINIFGKRLSFFFNAHNDFFEEIAKFRAARTLWANMMKEMGATDPNAMMLRFHAQTGGSTLTAQQPHNNITRVTMQALSAVLGGTQSLHTNGFDEALSLPSEEAARIALRTQQIIGYESGVTKTVDPMAGSYYVENLTEEISQAAMVYINSIDAMGGAVQAVEDGYIQNEIAKSSYLFQQKLENKEEIVVGLNSFINNDDAKINLLTISNDIRIKQTEKIERLKSNRNQKITDENLLQLANNAKEDKNLMPCIISCVESFATLGEIADTLREIYGEHNG